MSGDRQAMQRAGARGPGGRVSKRPTQAGPDLPEIPEPHQLREAGEHRVPVEHLDRYARLLVEFGVGLRPRQDLFVYGGVVHSDLARRVEEAAKQVAGSDVHLYLRDPLHEGQLIAAQNTALIDMYHDRARRWHSEILRPGGGLIHLSGVEYPDFNRNLASTYPEHYDHFTRGKHKALARFQKEAIQQSLCPVVVAPGLSPVAAQRAFPEAPEDQRNARLAELIFRSTYADQDDALELADARRRRMELRQQALNELGILEIRVTGGGNDFRVGFSTVARWVGASEMTVFRQIFHFNVPCEESFTTPDRRLTEGRLVATRPFRAKTDFLVKGLKLDFRDGRVVGFDASEGKDQLTKWFAADEGARYLGEFALVGEDSPIAQSGLFFDFTILDENASSHVALGEAYKKAVANGVSMTSSQLEKIGFNPSGIHTDIMFGSPEVSIVATRSRKGEVGLIDRGNWAEPFK